jgi:putative heme iron utilization protein
MTAALPPPPAPTEADKAAIALEARRLMRAAGVATLATQQDGQPFASLVTPATTPGCEVLLWLSTLSEHTRHLLREPRCALMVQGPPAGANPQTAPRLTVTGLAERVEGDAALKGRWLSRHPYAEMYAGFADFSLFRMAVQGAHWVGGFAMARRFRAADFLPDPQAVAAIAAAEADILGHVNADHADAVAAIARALGGPDSGDWRIASLDVDGCDLTAGEWVLRFCFGHPVREPDGVRRELILAARAARAGSASSQ